MFLTFLSNQSNHWISYFLFIFRVHVRRTDKVGTEAAFHGIEEYMTHVEEYFERYKMYNNVRDVNKKVYLATDDPGLLPEAKKK